MSQDFQAVYEQGVLRPLEPVSFREHEVVSLSVVGTQPAESARDAAAVRQQQILSAFVAKMESLPDEQPSDGLTNRDHDRLLYGE